jgi:hypothetical protein
MPRRNGMNHSRKMPMFHTLKQCHPASQGRSDIEVGGRRKHRKTASAKRAKPIQYVGVRISASSDSDIDTSA